MNILTDRVGLPEKHEQADDVLKVTEASSLFGPMHELPCAIKLISLTRIFLLL